jgi:hypothetical protein
MYPKENFEILNAKSCNLKISKRVLMFENEYVFLTFCCFFVHLRYESEQNTILLVCVFVIIISEGIFFLKLLVVFFVFSFIVVGTSCKYNYIPLYTEFRLKINRKPVGN